MAERAFLSALGGGCVTPVGAHAGVASSSPSDKVSQEMIVVEMNALVASRDGRVVIRVSGEGEPEELGERLAREALAAGANRILDAIHG